ncbi:MAG TPA: anthranilate phosphoribosyltransferase [Streptosporangiaceae bacterium]|nr:anthranilate phosphoribosyltransferase [Streptosporangiaceae bacterium]
MDARTTWPALIGALTKGETLTGDETAWAMNEIMEGAATPAQIAGFGIALRMKGETPAELGGLAQAMLDHASPIDIPGPVVDLVGTGGDGARTVNISTMGTIVAAAAGARMAKHGNRAASSACGAADLLEALGVVIDLPPQATERLMTETGVVFLFAALYHPALRHTAVPRRELGVPTVFNFLGPVANPARPGALAVGVADPRMGPVIAGVLAGRGCSALVFHGDDGLDELTTTAPSAVWVVHGGTVSQTVLDPVALGIGRSSPDDLRGGDPAYNAAVARAVFGGAAGPVRETVLLNAAAALAAEAGVPGPDDLQASLADGYARAARALDSGAAGDLLDRWVQASSRLAAEHSA